MKNLFHRTISLLLLLALVLSFSSAFAEQPLAQKVVILSEDRVNITTVDPDNPGDPVTITKKEYQLYAQASPEGAVQEFYWYIKEEEIQIAEVEVSSGKVTFNPEMAGTPVTIHVVVNDATEMEAQTTLVYEPSTKAVDIADPNGNIITGKTVKINTTEYQLSASGYTEGGVTWTSSDTDAATVNKNTGFVTFWDNKPVRITVTNAAGKSAWVDLELADVKPSRVRITNNIGKSISQETVKVTKTTYKLFAEIDPMRFVSQNVTWKSSNKKIATVDDKGVVTFIKAGEVKITATAADGSGLSDWTKLKTDIKADSVQIMDSAKRVLNKGKITINTKTVKLTAVAKPKKFASQKFTWKSSNTKIATVKQGKVTFKRAGKVKITVKARDGSKETAWVKITYKQPPVDKSQIP